MGLVFLLSLFIIITLKLNIVTTKYTDILDAIHDLYGNISYTSHSNELTPKKYLILFKNISSEYNELSRRLYRPKQNIKHAQYYETKAEKNNDRLAREQHKRRMEEIIDFMKNNHLTTLYLFKEVLRIKKEGVVMDPLRDMVQHLESLNREGMTEAVLNCYRTELAKENMHMEKVNIWNNNQFNNLLINHLKDPYNHGVINK